MRCQYALNVLAVNLDPLQQSHRNSGDSLCPRQLIGSVTMAANDIADVLRNPDSTRAAVQEYYNFVETFRALGAGASVTVIDVYHRMRERGLPTGYIDTYVDDTDPTAAAPTGKTYILPTSYRTSSSAVASCEYY